LAAANAAAAGIRPRSARRERLTPIVVVLFLVFLIVVFGVVAFFVVVVILVVVIVIVVIVVVIIDAFEFERILARDADHFTAFVAGEFVSLVQFFLVDIEGCVTQRAVDHK